MTALSIQPLFFLLLTITAAGVLALFWHNQTATLRLIAISLFLSTIPLTFLIMYTSSGTARPIINTFLRPPAEYEIVLGVQVEPKKMIYIMLGKDVNETAPIMIAVPWKNDTKAKKFLDDTAAGHFRFHYNNGDISADSFPSSLPQDKPDPVEQAPLTIPSADAPF